MAFWLDDLDLIQDGRTGRESSWDRTGGNRDNITIKPGKSAVIADIKGPGMITHIWLTQGKNYRECLIKITWDNAKHPSVLCPLGDFFCLGNSIVNNFESALFSASTRMPLKANEGVALNCYVPMRFKERALIELINESDIDHRQYYYVDYETYDEPPEQPHGYFHAEYRRANPFRGWGGDLSIGEAARFPNTERCAWENNYVILETKGKGHYIGCNMSVVNFRGDWWGEGDDMIWVDGYKWPPDIHGTGSEDYLNQAWGMNKTAFLRHGSSIWEGHTSDGSRYSGARAAYAGKLFGGSQSSYVFHVENPVRFNKEIKVTIEAGHANHQNHEISTVAYWYAEKPTKIKSPPPVKKRKAILQDSHGDWIIEKKHQCPGPDVAKNKEFQKAKAEYNKQGKKEGRPVIK
jgi:hypothetical protein